MSYKFGVNSNLKPALFTNVVRVASHAFILKQSPQILPDEEARFVGPVGFFVDVFYGVFTETEPFLKCTRSGLFLLNFTLYEIVHYFTRFLQNFFTIFVLIINTKIGVFFHYFPLFYTKK